MPASVTVRGFANLGLADANVVTAALEVARDEYTRNVTSALDSVSSTTTPIGATKNLLKSRQFPEERLGVLGARNTVHWTAWYAGAVRDGSSAHWAPLGRLALWCAARAPGIHPRALQRHIAREGTLPNDFENATAKGVTPRVNTLARALGRAVARAFRRR